MDLEVTRGNRTCVAHHAGANDRCIRQRAWFAPIEEEQIEAIAGRTVVLDYECGIVYAEIGSWKLNRTTATLPSTRRQETCPSPPQETGYWYGGGPGK